MQCAEFPMRTFFAGGPCTVATGLHLCKGLTRRENTLLNTAAICALIVAIVPERITAKDLAGDERVMQLVKDCPAVLEWAGRQPDLPTLTGLAVGPPECVDVRKAERANELRWVQSAPRGSGRVITDPFGVNALAAQ